MLGGYHLRHNWHLIQSTPSLSQKNLTFLWADPAGLLQHSQDECGAHQFEPQKKRQSIQWKHPSSPAPKKDKIVSSSGNVMTPVFWNTKGIPFIIFKRATTSRENTMPSWWDNYKELPKLYNCGFELVDRAHCSALAPSDYILFSNMKKLLSPNQYHSDNDIIFAVDFFDQ